MDGGGQFFQEGTGVHAGVCVHEGWQHIFSGHWCVNVDVQKFGSSLKFIYPVRDQRTKPRDFKQNFIAVTHLLPFSASSVLPNSGTTYSVVCLRDLCSLTSLFPKALTSPLRNICHGMETCCSPSSGHGEAVMWLQDRRVDVVITAKC